MSLVAASTEEDPNLVDSGTPGDVSIFHSGTIHTVPPQQPWGRVLITVSAKREDIVALGLSEGMLGFVKSRLVMDSFTPYKVAAVALAVLGVGVCAIYGS